MAAGAVLLQVLAVTLGAMVFWWLVSLGTKDTGVADRWWGLGVVLAALVAWLLTGERGPRFFVLPMVAAWAIRLSGHLYGRSQGQAEDARHAAMRRQHPDTWWWRSLVRVFLLQGVLLFAIALPVLIVLAVPQGPGFTVLDGVGVAVFVAGLVLEGVADMQLQLFRNDPGSRGRILTTGLWSWSRHPNYVGEVLVWWGLWLVAAAHGAWWTFVSPLLLTILLLQVTGIPVVEERMAKRPGWTEYRAATSPFIPWPPKRGAP